MCTACTIGNQINIRKTQAVLIAVAVPRCETRVGSPQPKTAYIRLLCEIRQELSKPVG